MPVDALHRGFYRAAFALLRPWWWLRRPEKVSAAVAAWHGGRLLVVRTSYHALLDLPGGGVEPGEAPVAAALRELREETGIAAPPDALGPPRSYRYRDLSRRVTNHVFAWHPAAAPEPVVDRREIVWAGLLTRAELAAARLSPLVRLYLADAPGGADGAEGAAEPQPPSGTRQISRA